MSNLNTCDPYEQLANAIVIAAAKDYRAAIKKLARGRKCQAALDMKEECLRFFRSGWFKTLTEIDPEYLIKKLDEEVEQ